MVSVIKILSNVTDICGYIQDEETKQKQLSRALEKAYHEASSDHETYVDCIDGFIFGENNPEAIIDLAKNWNEVIHARLTRAIGQYLLSEPASDPNKVLDTTTTYELVKASMAANDEMHDYARELLFNMVTEHDSEDTTWVFKSILRPHHLQHILEHPSEYAICEISVK